MHFSKTWLCFGVCRECSVFGLASQVWANVCPQPPQAHRRFQGSTCWAGRQTVRTEPDTAVQKELREAVHPKAHRCGTLFLCLAHSWEVARCTCWLLPFPLVLTRLSGGRGFVWGTLASRPTHHPPIRGNMKSIKRAINLRELFLRTGAAGGKGN